jgi:ABC-type transporter Mla subunit MlaD
VRTLEERRRKALQALEREVEQAKGQRLSTAISIGATLLTALTGRKTLSYSTITKAGTALRGAGRASKEKQDIAQAEETVETIAERLEELNAELEEDLEGLEECYDARAEELETVAIRPRKSDVDLKRIALAWRPEG